MTLSPSTKTVQNVLDWVKRQFGDESGAQITDTDIIRWINAGQNEINKRNRIIKGVATLPTIVGTRVYTFPAVRILSIDHLQLDGKPLEYMNFPEAQEYILKNDPEFTQSGTAFLWYEWGSDLFIYPNPSEVGTLSLYYIGYPTDVSAAGNTLSIPDSYYEPLLQFVMQQAYEQDDDASGAGSKAQQLDSSLNVLAEDGDGYRRGTYRTITILDEDYY